MNDISINVLDVKILSSKIIYRKIYLFAHPITDITFHEFEKLSSDNELFFLNLKEILKREGFDYIENIEVFFDKSLDSSLREEIEIFLNLTNTQADNVIELLSVIFSDFNIIDKRI